MKCSVRTQATAGGQVLPNPFHRTAFLYLYSLIVALILGLAGCATPNLAREQILPVPVAQNTWRQVDSDIGAASLAATESARNYSRGAMQSWRDRVHQRTEADFIPWFTDYWTQQWLAMRMGWYKLNAGDGTDSAVKRMTAYLQEQYHDQVLQPVAGEIDSSAVMERATKLYVQFLHEQLPGIPRRYGIPLDQFDQHLKDIPAIALAPPPAHSASLYQVIHTDPITGLPAYTALIDQIRKNAGAAEAGLLNTSISPVAKRASEKLMAKLATSGGAGVAAAAFGGIAGTVISLGTVGFGAVAHEHERPEMAAQLRKDLNAALDEMWFSLMVDPVTGVMAGVYSLSGQVEANLAATDTQAGKLKPLPRAAGASDSKDETADR